MQQNSAPLIVWFYTLLILFFLFASSLAIVHVTEAALPEKLQAPKKSPNSYRVVAVGSSLTGFAFYPDTQMTQFAQSQGIDSLEFFRYAKGGRVLERFDALFETLMQTDPDMVILEEPLLLYTTKPLSVMADSRTKIKNFFISLLTQHRWDPTFEKEVRYGFNRPGLQRELSDFKTAMRHWQKREFKPTKALENFLNYAKEHNIPVVMLHLPFEKGLTQHYPKALLPYEAKMRMQYHNQYATRSIRFDRPLDKTYFTDLVHASPKGRERFSTLLLEQIKTQRKQP